MNKCMAMDGNINSQYRNNVFVVLLLKNGSAFHYIETHEMYDDSHLQLNSTSIDHETNAVHHQQNILLTMI